MPTIIAVNPRPKARKKTATRKKVAKKAKKKPAVKTVVKSTTTKTVSRANPKKGQTMPKKRRRRRRKAAAPKTIVRYKYRTKRRNPKRSVRYAKQTFGGINISGAMKNTVPLLLGAVAAKFAAKKFAEGGGEGENWTWKNYALAMLGGLVAGFGTSALFKGKKATAQKVFEGACLLTAYKIFTNEIAPQNETLSSWFSGYEGADDFDPYAGYGNIWQGGEDDYVQGYDGSWRPVSEAHRSPAIAGYGDIVEPIDPTMGDIVEPIDSRMGGESAEIARAHERAYG